MSDPQVRVQTEGPLGLLTLNRPEALNALRPSMLADICDGMEKLQADANVRVIIVAGSRKVFAAGADIKAMAQASAIDMEKLDTLQFWKRMWALDKPLIAAVSGYALGGGCELAMTCDLIVASESARFAQSEIKVGIMPGAGGTQRLTRAIGPYRAMEMVLTGEPISAWEALAYGLANRVVPVERFLEEAKELGLLIASRPPIAVRLARQALRAGLETTLREGLKAERRNFYLTFDTDDQAEGMQAFIEKRHPVFRGQ
jgi:enoyl-CoA hydratase